MTLLTNIELNGSRRTDIRIDDGVITEIGRGLPAAAGSEVFNGGGGALIPGLHDHHMHLRALAAARSSVQLGPPTIRRREDLEDRIRVAAAKLPPGGWIRAVGHHASAGGELDRWQLDRIVADRPIRVQERSGSVWILNTCALREAGLLADLSPGLERDEAGRPTGLLHRMDGRLRASLPPVKLDIGGVSRELAALGVTGLTDATPGMGSADIAEFRRWSEERILLQRMRLMSDHYPVDPDSRAETQVVAGPRKVVLDDDALPRYEDLVASIATSHRRGQPVAVHCVTSVQAAFAVSAFELAGTIDGDRLEHASVLARELLPLLRRLGLTVVTQPNFIAERGDRYAVDVDQGELDDLYRCRSLVAAGVKLAAGTDAPFGDPDPWRSIAAAIDRETDGGLVVGADERLSAPEALRLFLGSGKVPTLTRRVRVGATADLCLLRAPLSEALSEPSAAMVRAVFIGGVPVDGRGRNSLHEQ